MTNLFIRLWRQKTLCRVEDRCLIHVQTNILISSFGKRLIHDHFRVCPNSRKQDTIFQIDLIDCSYNMFWAISVKLDFRCKKELAS